jgi:hypothetical protein
MARLAARHRSEVRPFDLPPGLIKMFGESLLKLLVFGSYG